MFTLKYTKKLFVFSNLLSRVIFIEISRIVYVSCFRNVTLFPVREHMSANAPFFRGALWDFSGSECSSALEEFRV